MFDLHCHLLPGIDDGPVSMRESLALASHAIEQGIKYAVMTPHIHPSVYDNNADTIVDAVKLFQDQLADHDIALSIVAGAEVRICTELMQMVPMQQIPFLGESEGYKVMLLEFPHSHILPGSDQLVGWLLKQNIRPLIAHPERNKEVHSDPGKMASFVSMGCMLQVTAASVAGDFGGPSRSCANYFLEQGWVEVLGSDAHNLKSRPPELMKGVRAASKLIGESAAYALVEENAYAIAGSRFER